MPKAYQTFQKMTALFCYNDLGAHLDLDGSLELMEPIKKACFL